MSDTNAEPVRDARTSLQYQVALNILSYFITYLSHGDPFTDHRTLMRNAISHSNIPLHPMIEKGLLSLTTPSSPCAKSEVFLPENTPKPLAYIDGHLTKDLDSISACRKHRNDYDNYIDLWNPKHTRINGEDSPPSSQSFGKTLSLPMRSLGVVMCNPDPFYLSAAWKVIKMKKKGKDGMPDDLWDNFRQHLRAACLEFNRVDVYSNLLNKRRDPDSADWIISSIIASANTALICGPNPGSETSKEREPMVIV